MPNPGKKLFIYRRNVNVLMFPSMRAAIGTMKLDELFHNRNTLNGRLKESIGDAAALWGLEVPR